MNGKKWRSIVRQTCHDLIEDFRVPEIPLEFVKDGSVFATETGYNTFTTKKGKFREENGNPFFLFPIYPELGQDYASLVLRQRRITALVPSEEPKPVHVAAHEFYHYLEFLTHGPMTTEEHTEEYRKKSEADQRILPTLTKPGEFLEP